MTRTFDQKALLTEDEAAAFLSISPWLLARAVVDGVIVPAFPGYAKAWYSIEQLIEIRNIVGFPKALYNKQASKQIRFQKSEKWLAALADHKERKERFCDKCGSDLKTSNN